MEYVSSINTHQEFSQYNNTAVKKILIVEDDKNMTVFLGKAILELFSDAEIVYASSLEIAVTQLINNTDIKQKIPYNLIIADIFLEGSGTGLDFYKVISVIYPTIPFLIISTEPIYEINKLFEIKNEKFSYLQKPFMFSQCKDKIKNIVTENQVIL